MTRRANRRAPGPKPKPFDAALPLIQKMEEFVAYRTVTRNFALMDVINYLWPREVVRALRDAYPFCHTSWRTTANIGPLLIPDGPMVTIAVETMNANMLPPVAGTARIEEITEPYQEAVWYALCELGRVHDKFEGVRDVVHWLNANATPGAARYYFPSLGALLPAEHPFHSSEGVRFKEPRANLGLVAHMMREASTSIATGLLSMSGDDSGMAQLHDVRVEIVHPEDEDGNMAKSQVFRLI